VGAASSVVVVISRSALSRIFSSFSGMTTRAWSGASVWVVPARLRRLFGRYGLSSVVAVFAAAALVQDLAGPKVTIGSHRYDRGPEVVIAAVLCGVVVLVALRRRLGVIAPLSALALLGLASIPARAWIIDSAFVFVLAMLVCGMGGFMAGGRRAPASLAVLWAVGSLVEWRYPDRSLGKWFVVLVYMTVAWGAGVIIRNRMDLEQRTAVIEERQRIARELHDVIAHSVSVMTVQAAAVRRLLAPAQQREREALVSVEQTGREALAEMRRLVGLMKDDHATPYGPQPGMQRLEALIGTVRDAGLPVELEVEGERRELPPGLDLAAFRVVQQALTNTLEHAGPAHAWVRVRWREDELRIEVENDGRDGAAAYAGHGQAGMRERLGLYGGRLEAGPRTGGGYEVRAYLPLETRR
jgi:signal transduction histidine kinase